VTERCVLCVLKALRSCTRGEWNGRLALHRLSLVWLLAAVVCAQALGFMHGIVHAFPTHAPHAAHVAGAPVGWNAASAGEVEGIEALFATHEQDQDCRLLDGLGQHAPALTLPFLPPADAPSSCAVPWGDSAFIVRWATLFDARAPPLSD
jgi:hypothetical protein